MFISLLTTIFFSFYSTDALANSIRLSSTVHKVELQAEDGTKINFTFSHGHQSTRRGEFYVARDFNIFVYQEEWASSYRPRKDILNPRSPEGVSAGRIVIWSLNHDSSVRHRYERQLYYSIDDRLKAHIGDLFMGLCRHFPSEEKYFVYVEVAGQPLVDPINKTSHFEFSPCLAAGF